MTGELDWDMLFHVKRTQPVICCGDCGRLNPAKANFCGTCGEKIHWARPVRNANCVPPLRGFDRPVVQWLLIAFAALAFGTLAIVW